MWRYRNHVSRLVFVTQSSIESLALHCSTRLLRKKRVDGSAPRTVRTIVQRDQRKVRHERVVEPRREHGVQVHAHAVEEKDIEERVQEQRPQGQVEVHWYQRAARARERASLARGLRDAPWARGARTTLHQLREQLACDVERRTVRRRRRRR